MSLAFVRLVVSIRVSFVDAREANAPPVPLSGRINCSDFPRPLYSSRNPTNPTFDIQVAMSGSSNFPTCNPTKYNQKPDKLGPVPC